MSQYPRRNINPAATGAAQQHSLVPPPRRYYDDDQSYLDGYPRPGRGRGRGRGSSSYSRPYTIIDEVTGERYYVHAQAPPNPSSAYYSFSSPPPRRRGEISDGRHYHPIQTSINPSYDHNQYYSPPTLGDVVLEEVGRLIPSLVDLGIAKLEQMSTRIKREKQRPVPEPEVRVNTQQNELQGSVSTRSGRPMGQKAANVASRENGKSTATISAAIETMSTEKEYIDNYMEMANESLTSLTKSKAKNSKVAALKADIKILEANPANMSESARAAHEKLVVQIKERWGL